MALTTTNAFGRLEMEYTAYGHLHVARFWVQQFGFDPGVGTFTTPRSPASLDALATALCPLISPMFASASDLAFGAWRGQKVTNPATGACIPVVEGTITPGTLTFRSSAGDARAVGQVTLNMRDASGNRVKYTYLGAVYVGPEKFPYSSLVSNYKNLVVYIESTDAIVGRSGDVVTSLIDVTFDTNDGLTRRYRR